MSVSGSVHNILFAAIEVAPPEYLTIHISFLPIEAVLDTAHVFGKTLRPKL